MPVCARPVRTLPKSAFSVSSVLCIFWSADFFTSATVMSSSPNGFSGVDQCAFVLAQHHPRQRTNLEYAEHADRQLLVAAQRQRGGIHYLELLHDRFVETDALVTHRFRMRLRVIGIDAVHLGRLQYDVHIHFHA